MKITYRSLFELVDQSISKKIGFNTKSGYTNQGERTLVAPGSGDSFSDRSSSKLITDIIEIIADSIPSHITEGFIVTATDPVSASVNISSGSGCAAGFVYTLEEDTSLSIPFDSTTEVFYINIYKNSLGIDKTLDRKKLNIAKIIVKNPGVTSRVVDTNDDSFDAYIQNFTEYKLYGDGLGKLEEDSIEMLRDNIGIILADNIIGNIRLSENLKITNTQGSISLDSSSLKIFDDDGNTLLRLDKDGTFIFSASGLELAKFTSTEARIGNIKITEHSVESDNFVAFENELTSGRGFRIKDDGSAEFENVRIRGILSSTVFEKDTISSIGGKFFVTECSILDEDMSNLDSSHIILQDNFSFSVGDILRVKDGINDEWLQVVSSLGNGEYTVTRDKASSYSTDNNPSWLAGTAVVNYGQSGEGFIYMTASDENAPYLSIITHEGQPWNDVTERLRIGRLNGFLDYIESGSAIYGIGIGELTKYLKYDPDGGLAIRGNLTMDAGFIGGPNGWLINEFEIVGSPSSRLMGGQTGYASGSGFFLGFDDSSGEDPAYKFSIGNSTNYLRWNGSALEVRGSLIMGDGSSIGSGIITSDAFVDTVAGDLSIGALFARNTLDANEKFSEIQTQTILLTGSYESGNPDSLVISEGAISVPSNIMWDESGITYDTPGLTWDGITKQGTYYYYSPVRDSGANFNSLPVLYTTRNLTSPDIITVEMRYSEDNATWSDWGATSRVLIDGTSRYYFNDIVKARYFQYKITFVSTGVASLGLSDVEFKVLALYKTLLYPDQAIADTGTTITGLSEFFSIEYSVDILAHGSTLLRGQIVKSVGAPDTLTITMVNESNVAVNATADIKLIGY